MKNAELRINILDRLTKFAVEIIQLANQLPKTPAGFAIASQIVKSGTSVGANMQEAQSAASKKDFIHCIIISLKESRETLYWLNIIKLSGLINLNNLSSLLKENDEIIRILVVIVKNSKKNSSFLTHHS